MKVPRSGAPQRRQRPRDRGQRAGVEMAGPHQPGAEPAIATAQRRLRHLGRGSICISEPELRVRRPIR